MGEMKDDNKNDLLSITWHVSCGNTVYTVSPICVLDPILLLTALPPAWAYFKFKLSGIGIKDLFSSWKYWVKRGKSHVFPVRGRSIRRAWIFLQLKESITFGPGLQWYNQGNHPETGPFQDLEYGKQRQLKIKNKGKRHRRYESSRLSFLISSESTGFLCALTGNQGKPRSPRTDPSLCFAQSSKSGWCRSCW